MKRTQDQQLSFCQLTLSCVAHHPKALPRLSSLSADKHDSEDMLVIGNCSSKPTVHTHEECVLIRRRKCPCSVRMCKLGQCTLPILGARVCAIIPKMASECRTVSCYIRPHDRDASLYISNTCHDESARGAILLDPVNVPISRIGQEFHVARWL